MSDPVDPGPAEADSATARAGWSLRSSPWARQARSLWEQFARGCGEVRRSPRALLRNPWLYLSLGVALYTVIFGTLSELRYWTFETYAWDLGVYNQAYYTTVFDHQFWFYTADLPSGTGGSLFAVHFVPFLYLTLPVYAIAPGVATLLYLQAFVVALGAVPAFALAKWRLGSASWGLLVAGVYLVLPTTQGVNWYDFHPEAFLPVAVLASLYFLVRRWPRAFLLFWVLALSIEETIAPFLILFAGVALLATLWTRRDAARREESGLRLDQRLLLAGLLIAVVWLVAATEVLTLYRPSVGAFGTNYGVNWSILGAPSALDVLPWAVLHPGNAWSALLYDADLKLEYAALLFGCLAFLPWLGEDRYLYPVLFWVVVASLSNTPAFYELGDQYLAYTVPFLIAGLVGGLLRLRSLMRSRAQRKTSRAWTRRTVQRLPRRLQGVVRAPVLLGAVVGVAALVGCAIATPLLAAPPDSYSEILFGIPSVDEHDDLVHQLLALLPAHAGVLTTSPLFPEVSSRADAYVLPEGSYFAGNLTWTGVVAHDLDLCPYVFVDFQVDFTGAEALLSAANLSAYGILGAADGAYLYERGYHLGPRMAVPEGALMTAPGDLLLGDAVIEPRVSGPLGASLYHAPGSSNGSQIFSGPFVATLPPGVYDLNLSLQVSMHESSPQVGFVLTREPALVSVQVLNPSPAGRDYGFTYGYNSSAVTTVGEQTLSGPTSGASSLQGNLTVQFDWVSPGLFYLTSWALSSTMSMYVYEVSIAQLAPLAP